MSETKRAVVTRCDKLKRVGKTWGLELWLQDDGGARVGYCGKLLRLEEGASGSLHYHPRKHETMLVAEGCVHIEITPKTWPPAMTPIEMPGQTNEIIVLGDGDVIELPAGVPHRMEAVGGPATVFEVSTPHDDDDVVRIEESRPARG